MLHNFVSCHHITWYKISALLMQDNYSALELVCYSDKTLASVTLVILWM